MTGNSSTLASGGFISGSSGPHITMTHSANMIVGVYSNKMNNSLKGLTLEPWVDPVRCHDRRGGPRSKVYCEVPKPIPHEFHMGRGNTGRWFSWKDRVETF